MGSIVLGRARCSSTPPEPGAPVRDRGSESPRAEPLELPLRVYNPTLSLIAFTADQQAALAMGTEGTVLRSTDDGRSWSRVETGSDEQLVDAVVHPASKSLLVAGSRGTLLRTQDAGESFSRVWVDSEAGFHAMAVSPVDGTIVVVGDDGVAYASKDGGNSFTREKTGVTSYLSQIVAVRDKARFVVGGDLGHFMLRDEAGHWRSLPTPAKMLVTALATLPDASLLAGTQDGFILRSADSGETWTESSKMREDTFVLGFESSSSGSVLLGRLRTRRLLLSSDQGRSFRELPFRPDQGLSRMVWLEDQGFVGLGLLGAVIRSDPTGTRWSVRPERALGDPRSVAMHPVTKTVLAVGASGLIARSADQGRSFEVVRPGLGGIIRSIAWSPADGCLVAVGLDATIVRSDRRGTEWSPVRLSVDPKVEWTQVVFEPQSGAFVASGSNGSILRSTDCGGSWTRNEVAKVALTSLLVHGKGALLALSAGGPIQRSVDGGRTFSPCQMDLDATLRRAVLAGDGSALVAVGNQGRIYRSLDQAWSWQRVASGTMADLRALELDPAGKTLWAAGDSGVVLKSTDGGRTFSRVPVPTAENLFVIGLDPTPGVVILGGNRGTVLRSDDRGTSFVSLESGSRQTIRVAMLDPLSGEFIVAGSGGTLLRTTPGKRLLRIAGTFEGRMDAAVFHPPTGTIFIGGDRLVGIGR